MSKLNRIGLQFFADPAAPPAGEPAIPPVTEPGTSSTAGTVDIEAITQQAAQKAAEAAEKKMEAVFKSMLEQQGLDSDAISKMTADWKSKQRTPEIIAKELEDANKRLADENEALNAQMLATSRGIPADWVEKYVAFAKTYPGADKDLGKALDAAVEDFPLVVKRAGVPGAGAPPRVQKPEPQNLKDRIAQKTEQLLLKG